MPTSPFEGTIQAIDAFNGQDPHKKELPYSEALTAWVLKLNPKASDLVKIAARGQHIGRWIKPRDTYEKTRGGYLRWREDLKKFHAQKTGELMHEAGYGENEIQMVKNIILKKNLKDPDTQTVEDALCLVFLETQFSDLKTKTSTDKMKLIIRKTWKKMSTKGKDVALALRLPEENLKLIKEAILALLLLLLPSAVFAGAWPREKGEVYSKLSISRFESDQIFGPKNNTKLPGPDFEETGYSLYEEYGFTNKWTGIFNVSYKSLSSTLNGVEQTEAGFSDLWLYAKRGVLSEPFVLAFQGGVKLPLGYSKTDNPPLGDGQIDTEIRLLVGKSLYPWPMYAGSEIGYRKRNGDVSDEIVFRIEAGAYLSKRWLLTLALDGVQSQSDDTASTTGNRNPNVFDEEFTKLSPGVIFMLNKGWALTFNYEDVIAGGNTAAGQSYIVGVSWQGKPFQHSQE